jgi:hypothetical protein
MEMKVQGNASLMVEAFEIKVTEDPGSLGPGWFLIGYEKLSRKVAAPQVINVPTWNPGSNGSCAYYGTIPVEIPFCEDTLAFIMGRRRDDSLKSLQDGWALDKALVEKLKRDLEVLQGLDGISRDKIKKLQDREAELGRQLQKALKDAVEAEGIATTKEKLAGQLGQMVDLLKKEVGEKRFKEIVSEATPMGLPRRSAFGGD